MGDWLVVLDVWPPADIPAASSAWTRTLGGTQMDHARQLRSCTGIAAQRLTEADARKLAAALSGAKCRAFAAPAAMVQRLPRPLVASRLDPRPDALHAQVSLTGPAESIPYKRIVLVLPAARIETKTVGGGVKKPKVGIGTAALAATTGIGAGKVIKAIRGKGEALPEETHSSNRALVELVCVGPLQRFQGYADRLDYSVLGDERVQGKRNFGLLLGRIRDRTRADLASRPALDRYIDTGQLPGLLTTSDNNELAAVSRWLLLRGAVRRLAGLG